MSMGTVGGLSKRDEKQPIKIGELVVGISGRFLMVLPHSLMVNSMVPTMLES